MASIGTILHAINGCLSLLLDHHYGSFTFPWQPILAITRRRSCPLPSTKLMEDSFVGTSDGRILKYEGLNCLRKVLENLLSLHRKGKTGLTKFPYFDYSHLKYNLFRLWTKNRVTQTSNPIQLLRTTKFVAKG